MCVVLLAPTTIIMIGGTCQPLVWISLRRGEYFMVLHWILSIANRSLVYVNSMNCILIWGSGWSGGVPLCGIPWMQSISGLKQALQWHQCGVHEHWSNQGGILFSGGKFRNFPAFMMV